MNKTLWTESLNKKIKTTESLLNVCLTEVKTM